VSGGIVPAGNELAARLEDELYAFNQDVTGYRDGVDLAFKLEDEGGLAAGIAGYTWGGLCEIKQLWVREDRRGGGLGEALVRAAVGEARARGCSGLILTTHSFQAPDFYAKLGFETVAVIEDKPPGHTEHVLRLRL